MKFLRYVGSGIVLSVFLFICVCAVPSQAAAVSMTLYPDRGYALLDKPFAVDVMLDSEGEDLMEVRAVFRFDPTRVTVTKAEYGELFCQYPEDEYAVDNSAGWIKLTGYCNDPYYNSNGTPGLFGRFTFEPRMEGTVDFEFVETYDDELWISRALDTGSPPQEIMGIDYEGGTYTVVSSITPPDDGTNHETKLPGVGIFDDNKIVFGAILLGCAALVLGAERVIHGIKQRRQTQNRTVIV